MLYLKQTHNTNHLFSCIKVPTQCYITPLVCEKNLCKQPRLSKSQSLEWLLCSIEMASQDKLGEKAITKSGKASTFKKCVNWNETSTSNYMSMI